MRAVVAVLLFVTAAHAGLWGLFQQKQPAPDFRGILPSLSYAPFEPRHTVADGDVEKVRADLKKLSTLTRAIRLYSSTEGNELVPPIAAEFGVKVTVGAWIDKDKDRNKREIEAVINTHPAVMTSLLDAPRSAGNERGICSGAYGLAFGHHRQNRAR